MRTPRWLGKLAHLRGSRRRCRGERLRAQRARNCDDRQSRGALRHGLRERGHVGVERLQGPGCAGRPRLHRLVGRAGNEQWYSDGTGHRQLGLPRRWIADRSVCPNSLQGPEPGRQPGQPARVQDRQRREAAHGQPFEHGQARHSQRGRGGEHHELEGRHDWRLAHAPSAPPRTERAARARFGSTASGSTR